jgi:DNA ligase 1
MGIERRTCKHLRKLRGNEAETARVGSDLPARPAPDTAVARPLLLAEAWDGDANLAG